MINSSEADQNDGVKFMKWLLASLVTILLIRYMCVILTPKYSRSEIQTFRQGLLGDVWKDADSDHIIV